MLDFNGNRVYFFLFCNLEFNDFLNRLGGIHDYFGQKILKTQVVFMKCKKQIETTWPPGWARGAEWGGN